MLNQTMGRAGSTVPRVKAESSWPKYEALWPLIRNRMYIRMKNTRTVHDINIPAVMIM